MIPNHIRNRKIRKKYGEDSVGYDSEGSLIEDVLFEAKNKNLFIIRHIQYADKKGNLTTLGIYKILTNKEKVIGNLKYVFYDKDDTHPYMKLCDIYFDISYRNIGLGSETLKLFEKRANDYGALYIDGILSDVDEVSMDNQVLRDIFYQNAGYTIDNNKIFKKLPS